MRKLLSSFFLTVSLTMASTIFFQTPAGSTTGGQPVSATASITTNDNGTITVTLNNLFANPTSATQLVTDLFFTLSAAPGSALNTTTTPVATLIDLTGASTVGVPIDPWTLTSSGAVIHLDSLPGDPDQGIIGPGPYTNANGSLTGAPHNPLINQTATFSFAVSGVTSATNVTAATFSFNTEAGFNVPGEVCTTNCGTTTQATPEPMSMFLVGGGLLFAGCFRKFRRG
jgi:hypothetical protein